MHPERTKATVDAWLAPTPTADDVAALESAMNRLLAAGLVAMTVLFRYDGQIVRVELRRTEESHGR